MKKEIVWVFLVFLLLICALVIFLIRDDISLPQHSLLTFPSEKSLYAVSDIGTEVWQVTSNEGEDSLFYQEPVYFSPDDKYFLFRSNRGDGEFRLYVLEIETGVITRIREDTSFGWVPTWSSMHDILYVGGRGKIVVLNVTSGVEETFAVPSDSWVTFLHLSPDGSKIVFVEERVDGTSDEHVRLSVIEIDGTGYQQLYELDTREEFYLDHPIFIDDVSILFLTRGKERDFTGAFNNPYIINLDGTYRRLPLNCSHYDVHNGRILCASEGYIIDLEGTILRTLPVQGHGVFARDGETFLMTADSDITDEGSPYYGKILLFDIHSEEIITLVHHENTYDSSLEVHIQPNAQFSRNGAYIMYESDQGRGSNTDLYLVSVH